MTRAAEFRTIMDESIDAPAGYGKQTLWAACYKQWTMEWQQLSTCRMTKIFFPKPDKNKTKKLLKHGRAYMQRFIECTTGHNNLNYLQGKYIQTTSPNCADSAKRNQKPLTTYSMNFNKHALTSSKSTHPKHTYLELGRHSLTYHQLMKLSHLNNC